MRARTASFIVSVAVASLLVVPLGAARAQSVEAAASEQAAPALNPAQWPQVIDEPGQDDDRIVLTRVDGVIWQIDDEQVPIPAGQARLEVPMPGRTPASEGDWVWSNGANVRALGVDGSTVSAPGAYTTMDLVPEWWVGAFRGARSTAALTSLSVGAYPRTLPGAATTTVFFSPFAGATGLVWGYVHWRPVTAGPSGRSVGPWASLPTFPGSTPNHRLAFSGKRGHTYEFRVRATDRADASAASTVTGWSAPSVIGFAQDAKTDTGTVRGGMRSVRQVGAEGGRVLRSTRPDGSWTSRPWYGDELALAFAVGPSGSRAEVLVDGRPRAMVDTYEPRAKQRQLRYLLRGLAAGRAHTVTVVNRPAVPGRSRLDLDAFIVTSTK